MSLAALAVAIARGPRRRLVRRPDAASAAIAPAQALSMQSQLNFTRENEYEADRIGFQRLDAAGFDVQRDGDVHGAAAAGDPLLGEQRAVVPAHAPDHLRAHRRGAGARAGHAVPPGPRLARLPPGPRAAAELPGRRAQEAVALLRRRASPSASTTARSPRITASSRRCCARKGPRAPRQELATLEKIAPPHPMIDAIAAHVLLENGEHRRRDAALRDGAADATPTRCSSSTTIPRR